MTKFNVGDEITTEEQLADLPVDTILKLTHKAGERIYAGIIQNSTINGETSVEISHGYIHQNSYHKFLDSHTVTILELPKRKWKVGDVVCTAEEFESLPAGAVVVYDSAKSDVFQHWGRSYMPVGFDEEHNYAEMERLRAPARIIHLPNKGES